MTPIRIRRTALALGLAAVLPASAAPQPGEQAPLVTLPDLDGKSVTVGGPPSAADATVTSLYFMAAWCDPCLAPLRELELTAARLAPRGYRATVIGVATREDAARLRELTRLKGIELPILYDGGQSAERAYGVGALPWHVVIDQKGVIRKIGPPEKGIRAAVEALLEEP